MARNPEPGLETSLSKPTVILHKPCAWNPQGVSAAVCDRQTRIPLRNAQGCCAIGCRSPRRVCKVCALTSDKKNLVTDFDQGTCAEHSDNSPVDAARLTRMEQGQSLPHLASLAVLQRQVRVESPRGARSPYQSKKKGASAAEEGDDLADFNPSNHLDLLVRLSVNESRLLALAGEGRTNKEIAGEIQFTLGSVVVYLSKMYIKLSLTYLPKHVRREALARVGKQARENEDGPAP